MMQTKALLLVILLAFTIISRAEGPGSFEAFYKEKSTVGWAWVVGGAALAGGVVFFTGGTASPLVAGIGSWVGGMMGLSGAAATSAGLATLGFGPLAAGGWGMAGGAALVTAGLTIAGDAALDKGLSMYLSERRYQALAEYSKSMHTLCFPRNLDGSAAYREAVEALESIRLCTEAQNKSPRGRLFDQLDQIIATLKSKQEKINIDETAKEDVLLSLLYFIRNDYRRAHFYVDLVFDYDRRNNNGLAQYLYAVTGLYLNRDTYDVLVNQYLRKALLEDKENRLIYQLLGIFVERSLLAASLGRISWDSPIALLDMLGDINELRRYQSWVAVALLDSYVQAGKEFQGRIQSLKNAVNPLIVNAPQTQQRIQSLESKFCSVRSTGDALMAVIKDDERFLGEEHVYSLMNVMRRLTKKSSMCIE